MAQCAHNRRRKSRKRIGTYVDFSASEASGRREPAGGAHEQDTFCRRNSPGASRSPLARLRLGARMMWCALLLACCSSATAKETLVRDVDEFDAAVKTAEPGDAIVLADGEWRDADLVFHAKGGSTAPITLRGQTPGKVVLTGSSRLRIGGEYLRAHSLVWRDSTAKDDVVAFRVDSKTLAHNCIFLQSAILSDVPDRERKYVSIYGDRNSVSQCRFEGKQSKGTLLVVWLGEGDAPNKNSIVMNFFGARSRLGKNGGEMIRIGDSKTSLQSSQSLVMANYFYRCDGEAEIISNKSCDNEIVNNTFTGCSGAVTLRHGNRCRVHYNTFFGDGRSGTGGVRVIGEGHVVENNWFYGLLGDDARAAISMMNGIPNSPANAYFQVKNAVVRKNTFVDCKQNILVGLSDDDQKNQNLPPTDCRFEGNVVLGKRPVFEVLAEPVGTTYDTNFYQGGELGLADGGGWELLSVRPNVDAVRNIWPVVNKGKVEDVEVKSHQYIKPQDVGSFWIAELATGEEFLPEILKPEKKPDAK
ncbi:MAG: polysaccharide lyase 6 family protein [Pirellulales bacterium]